jgi:predicted Holliday junction resolvase-like endonuclease
MNKVDKEDLTEVTQQLLDNSTEVAYEFVEEELIPQLEYFEYESDEDEYITGCATFVLFTRLIGKMKEIGYDVDELKQLTEQYYDMNYNDTLH